MISSLDRRTTAIEEARERAKPQEQQEPPKQQSRDDVAKWYASLWNWTMAAKTAGITEDEAVERWGGQVGWYEHLAEVERLDKLGETMIASRQSKPADRQAQDKPRPTSKRREKPKPATASKRKERAASPTVTIEDLRQAVKKAHPLA